MGSEKKVENLSLLCGKKCLKNSLFSPREKERSFFEVSLDEETTILLFREFSSAKVLFHFSRASRHLLSVHPPKKKKNLERFRRFDTKSSTSKT